MKCLAAHPISGRLKSCAAETMPVHNKLTGYKYEGISA
jgi:hypothetical protein